MPHSRSTSAPAMIAATASGNCQATVRVRSVVSAGAYSGGALSTALIGGVEVTRGNAAEARRRDVDERIDGGVDEDLVRQRVAAGDHDGHPPLRLSLRRARGILARHDLPGPLVGQPAYVRDELVR